MGEPETIFFNKERLNNRISSVKFLLLEFSRPLQVPGEFCGNFTGKKYLFRGFFYDSSISRMILPYPE
jgi:hypothetical protein